MQATNLSAASRQKRRDWLAALSQVTDRIGSRQDAKLPTQEAFNRAALLRPSSDISLWAGPVSLYHVDDSESRHIVVVMDGGDVRQAVIMAECSCRQDTCPHLLGVLAVHPGKLT